MSPLHVFFHWPDGGIWSNILASIVIGVIAWFWKIKPHFKKEQQHREYMRMRTEQLHKHLKVKH